MKADHAPCAHCGRTKDQHKPAEQSGEVNHQFSGDGQLAPVERTPPGTFGSSRPQQPQVVIAPSPDIMLRKMLLELGVITQEQYAMLFVGKTPSDR